VAVARGAVQISERRACGLMLVVRGTYRYTAVIRQANDELRQKLRELAMVRRRFGYRRLHALLRREGLSVNHKRVYRLYVQEQLWVRKRNRKRRIAVPRVPMLAPTDVNQVWSMDFVSDALASGRRFRTLNITDDYSREAPAIEVDTSLGGVRVTRVLDRLKVERGLPRQIRSDNGPEFISKAVEQWAHKNNVDWHFIEPGKPIENAYVESFNARFRDECLNENWFLGLTDARQEIEIWRQDYNQRRPHSSLGYRTPEEFAQMTAKSRGKDGDKTALENAPRFPLSHNSGGGCVTLSNPPELSL
jgi:putative transposase